MRKAILLALISFAIVTACVSCSALGPAATAVAASNAAAATTQIAAATTQEIAAATTQALGPVADGLGQAFTVHPSTHPSIIDTPTATVITRADGKQIIVIKPRPTDDEGNPLP